MAKTDTSGFDAKKRYTTVKTKQGKVQQDSDWNKGGGGRWLRLGAGAAAVALIAVAGFVLWQRFAAPQPETIVLITSPGNGAMLPQHGTYNVSGEASKYGWPAADERSFQAAIPDLEKILQLQHVLVRGLMSMAPLTQNPAEARPHFAHTRMLRDELKTRFPQGDWSQLSMGMSADFEAAILEGASLVRIGTAVLGPRPY